MQALRGKRSFARLLLLVPVKSTTQQTGTKPPATSSPFGRASLALSVWMRCVKTSFVLGGRCRTTLRSSKGTSRDDYAGYDSPIVKQKYPLVISLCHQFDF
ncbi:uncharacterized protein BT62DRAFT_938099 [Guyanagaster necrorhizus]|uniref:Secreted protein n=1 Tax=Guyanagaster necrorhizus TaxID=856835 RepID=A0A9P8AL29_9AGAR|nr:uncharacterized protein BT62DRAFT_939217 [Guyanagaster necrorhizus MCA 3950]XP_043033798.1 uncharacterized protein BT62DRAFT_938099 [Guyanagaster necrorhizus MCA 3950]KAG7439191.1 hypothetical protein BT62DRAFT_939217 [Guyanagaster necrorhizus MCA 3950]KAG7440298.1 hypothetical protein BT62DRAFT_938099 [Guyanagaster necrorhizus MCA 3950]